MKLLSKRKFFIFLILGVLLVYIAVGLYQGLEVTHYTYISNKIPSNFDGFKIVQISDFHCKSFGSHEQDLIQAVREQNPSLIVLTGDMVDGSHPDITPVKELISGISTIAPIYAVSGNHDFDSTAPYTQLSQLYSDYGVINLDESQSTVTINGSSFSLYGLSADKMDPVYNQSAMPQLDTSQFNICLYHYASHFDYYSKYGFDLVFSGHTHGGIVRLPIVGGLLNNDGGFFPKYSEGEYTKDSTTMIVSRGLGNSFIPRFYNRPELVCVTLQSH